jgi:hypothetical protein
LLIPYQINTYIEARREVSAKSIIKEIAGLLFNLGQLKEDLRICVEVNSA